MDSRQKPEWFLEVEGKRLGPYSANQIADLFREREILGHYWVTSERESSTRLKVSDFVQTYTATPQAQELTHGLFDALQAVQRAKASTQQSFSDSSITPNPPKNRLFILIVLGLISIALIMGLIELTRKNSDSEPPAASKAASESETRTAPPKELHKEAKAEPRARPTSAPAEKVEFHQVPSNDHPSVDPPAQDVQPESNPPPVVTTGGNDPSHSSSGDLNQEATGLHTAPLIAPATE